MVYYEDFINFPYYYPADTLQLTNQTTKEVYSYEVKPEFKAGYLTINGEILKNLPDGQYNYQLGNNTGIFQKGNFNNTITEYNKEIIFKQYEG